jgi:hypothetical protein
MSRGGRPGPDVPCAKCGKPTPQWGGGMIRLGPGEPDPTHCPECWEEAQQEGSVISTTVGEVLGGLGFHDDDSAEILEEIENMTVGAKKTLLEELEAGIKSRRPDFEKVDEIQVETNTRIDEIRTTDPEDRGAELDDLVAWLEEMAEEVDVFDRPIALKFDQILARAETANSNFTQTQDSSQGSIRLATLRRLRSLISVVDQRFGVVNTDTRVYVSPLFPTLQEASDYLNTENLDVDTHEVMEHFGDGWSSFIKLNVSFDKWQEYIQEYHKQVLKNLEKLLGLPGSAPITPAPPLLRPDGTQAPVITTSTSSSRLSGRSVSYLDPNTGNVVLLTPGMQPPGAMPSIDTIRTGDRDHRGRPLSVSATLAGVVKWVEGTRRTYGDSVSAISSAEGGIIGLVITGDFDLWKTKINGMKIPVEISIREDEGHGKLHVAYVIPSSEEDE